MEGPQRSNPSRRYALYSRRVEPAPPPRTRPPVPDDDRFACCMGEAASQEAVDACVSGWLDSSLPPIACEREEAPAASGAAAAYRRMVLQHMGRVVGKGYGRGTVAACAEAHSVPGPLFFRGFADCCAKGGGGGGGSLLDE